MSDLLAEIDDAMRQERMEKFFHEHGALVIGFIVLTIVLTGAISGYKHWNVSQQEKGTAALTALLDDSSFPDNIAGAKLDMRGGPRGIALLSAGGAYLDQDKPDEALALYRQATEDKAIPEDLRHLAILMTVRLDQPSEAAIAALNPIIKDRKSPWRYHAMLEAANLQANFKQDFAAAIALLDQIQQAEGLPDTFYSKARALSQVYALKQQKQDQSS